MGRLAKVLLFLGLPALFSVPAMAAGPGDPIRQAQCGAYAQQALGIIQAARALEQKSDGVCTFPNELRWQPDFNAHLGWCLTDFNLEALSQAETGARAVALDQCQKAIVAADATTGIVSCRGGGNMTGVASKDGFLRIVFERAAAKGDAHQPRDGECAWSNRPFKKGEASLMTYPASSADAEKLLAAAAGGYFTLRATVEGGVLKATEVLYVEVDSPPPSVDTSTSADATDSDEEMADASDEPSDPTAIGEFSGMWLSKVNQAYNYIIQLEQDGNKVEGFYLGATGLKGTISGKVVGSKLTYKWVQGDRAGTGTFVLDGDVMDGKFNTTKPKNDPTTGTWRGERQ